MSPRYRMISSCLPFCLMMACSYVAYLSKTALPGLRAFNTPFGFDRSNAPQGWACARWQGNFCFCSGILDVKDLHWKIFCLGFQRARRFWACARWHGIFFFARQFLIIIGRTSLEAFLTNIIWWSSRQGKLYL